MPPSQHQDLFTILSDLYVSCEALRAFAPLPDDLVAQSVEPHHRAASHALQQDTHLQSHHHQELQTALIAASPQMHWREVYRRDETSPAHLSFDFMDKLGVYALIGETGPFMSQKMALYMVYMPAGFSYPWHAHKAEEFYYILSGEAVFRRADHPDITLVPARDMAVIAKNAPKDAYHIIVTYSHQIDEAICHALLSSAQYGRIGLIGSQTKKARFAKRLAEAGHNADQIADIICPIGLKEITSKDPAYVALSIAGQLAMWQEADS